MTVGAHWYGNTALQHVLQQTYCLEAHGLTACVGARYEQYAVLGIQVDVKRNDCLVMLGKRLFEQRMHGLYPVNHGLALHNGLAGVKINRQACLGTDKVNLCHERVRIQYGGYLGAYAVSECNEYAGDLTFLVGLKFANAVVCLDHLLGFDEYGLARCGLIVNYTAYLAFQAGGYRKYQSTVTHGRSGILVDQTVTLGLLENAVQDT